MIFLLLSLFAIGAALSRSLKVLGMVPATVISWSAAINLSRFEGFSWLASLTFAFLAGLCLQIGYVFGAFIFRTVAEARRKARYADVEHAP